MQFLNRLRNDDARKKLRDIFSALSLPLPKNKNDFFQTISHNFVPLDEEGLLLRIGLKHKSRRHDRILQPFKTVALDNQNSFEILPMVQTSFANDRVAFFLRNELLKDGINFDDAWGRNVGHIPFMRGNTPSKLAVAIDRGHDAFPTCLFGGHDIERYKTEIIYGEGAYSESAFQRRQELYEANKKLRKPKDDLQRQIFAEFHEAAALHWPAKQALPDGYFIIALQQAAISAKADGKLTRISDEISDATKELRDAAISYNLSRAHFSP